MECNSIRVLDCETVCSSGYLGWGWWLNQRAIRAAEDQLADRDVRAEVHAFPAFFQMSTRRVVALNGREAWVGFVDAADPGCITWDRASREPDPWVERLRQTREGAIFSWFTSGIDTWSLRREPEGWRVELSDLRYGREANARRGMWGVTALFNEAGELLESPRHYMVHWEWSLRHWLGTPESVSAPADCLSRSAAPLADRAGGEPRAIEHATP